MSVLPMYQLYSALLAAGLLVSFPFWLWQAVRHGKYRAGLSERWGKVPARLKAGPAKPAIWVHAVSVGEVLAVSGLVGHLRRQFPEYRVVVSTTTDTGQQLARSRFGEQDVFYLPMDFSFTVKPFIKAVNPALIVIAETEFWPNFLRLGREAGARIAVVNARISDRSLSGYRRFRGLLSRVLHNVDLFLAQTEQDAFRLREIGAPESRIQVSGNLKMDAPMPPELPIVSSLRAVLKQSGCRPVIICGSTVEGEESLLLKAFLIVRAKHSRAVMILAPRHPERFEAVARLLQDLGLQFWRRSRWIDENVSGGVLLLDSIGELAAIYALADIAFVGGSLVPRGGHNILEPAQHGVAIVVGNFTENFRDIVELFREHDAVQIVDSANLAVTLEELAGNEEARAILGRRAAQALRTQMGATQKTLDALERFIAARAPSRRALDRAQIAEL